jgi:hypothetical protein
VVPYYEDSGGELWIKVGITRESVDIFLRIGSIEVIAGYIAERI